MIIFSKIKYIDKFHDIVLDYNGTVRSTINMKRKDITSTTYTEYSCGVNKNKSTFKINDHVRISKQKTVFRRVTI